MSKRKGSFRVALTGDSIIARRITATNDAATKELINVIKSADVAFTNLEVLPNDFVGYPAARSDGAHFAAHSWVLDDLREMGFNLYSCANNHALDYGTEGLLETIRQLEKRSICYAGIGHNLAEARMPVYLDHGEGTVAMISCTSTFFEEQSAGEQRVDLQGRPGVNPLRFDVVYEVTREQFDLLRSLSQDLGLERQRQEFIRLGFAQEPKDPNLLHFVDQNFRVFSPLNAYFRAAERPAIKTEPNHKDLEEICKWVREAKSRADVVIVSLHAHEQGEDREKPAEFITKFAYRVIDEGADIVVGHGPHLLRGMELYQGKPIFYSLGNLIGQNELIYKLPADSYKRFGIEDWQTFTPSDVFRIRSQGGRKGFPADKLYWQTVMPICEFADGKLSQIKIVPVGLTHGNTPHERGRPYLAQGDKADEILSKFAELSLPYGTKITDGVVEW